MTVAAPVVSEPISLRVPMRAEHITKVFPGTTALDDVTFDVFEGQVNVLVGENGAGKSTLLKAMMGEIAGPKRSGAALVFDSTSDHFECQAAAGLDVQTQDARIEVGPQRVDVVHHQHFELRAFVDELGQHAILEQIGDFEPVADGVEALLRHVVAIVCAFAHLFCPANKGSVQAFEHFLRLFIE